jgi:Chaperone of endosialidase
MPFSTVPFIFSPNTLIQSAQVNADFASVVEDGNNIDASQITTGVLPVVHGGTGVTTPGEITTSIGAVAKTGDTMTGPLTVPNIVYSANPAHSFAFSWDGTNTHVVVDGVDFGIIGDIASVSAGNGLAGGGTSGNVTLAMSGSYSGNFTASGTVQAQYLNSTGDGNIAGFLNTGNLGVYNNAQVNGSINCNGNVTGAYVHSNGDLLVDGTLRINYLFGAAPGSGVAFTSHLFPQVDGGVYCGLAAWAWAGVESYAYITKSDPALKRDIEPVPPGCLGLVNAITPKTYKLNLEADHDKTHWGFIAPEIGEAMQHAGLEFGGVRTDGDAPSSLAYNELIAVLWGAVQELTARVKALEAADGAA